MVVSVLLLLIFVFLAVVVLTWHVRSIAMSHGTIDYPNQRSSHQIPTPRGGGLSFVIVTIACVFALWIASFLNTNLAIALLGGGIAVATVGFLDDLGSLRVSLRIAVHIISAGWAMYFLSGLPAVRIGQLVIDLGIYGHILGTFSIIWILNLFNFMDGIDGIAASEAAFVSGAGAGLAYIGGVSGSASLAALLLSSACLGFLVLNWPPAKIFMGDVGSGYLGYVIAVLAIAEARTNPVALFVWLTLGGVFFVDATVTLIRRLLRGERVHEAHRSHAYQWLARRWNSHRRVAVLVILINLFWLLPLAWCCVVFPSNAWWISLVSLVPLIVVALIAGAGRPEKISAS